MNKLLGYSIDKKAHIGKSLILAKALIMREYSSIGTLNFCKRIDTLILFENACIGSLNYITGFGVHNIEAFKHNDRKCEFILGRHARVTSRHYFDCNGGIYIGDYTTVAGLRTQVLTHSIDIKENIQDAKPVRIGKYCFIGTGCIILKNSILPNFCVLGAGAVLTSAFDEEGTILGGVPARVIKKINISENKYFYRENGFVL